MFNIHATSIVHQGNKIHMEIVAYSSAFCLGEGVWTVNTTEDRDIPHANVNKLSLKLA